MKQLNIPEGYQAVMPYLILKDAAAFMQWAIAVLDATEKMRVNRDDGSIMHAELKIGDSTVMLGEASDQWTVNTAGMFVYVADVDQAYAKALARRATSVMEPATKDYGRTSGVVDPFGNTWWITSTLP